MSEITSQDITDWKNEPVTREFFLRIVELREQEDKEVHKALEEGKLEQAAYANAGKTQLEEVLELPGNLMDEVIDDS